MTKYTGFHKIHILRCAECPKMFEGPRKMLSHLIRSMMEHSKESHGGSNSYTRSERIAAGMPE